MRTNYELLRLHKYICAELKHQREKKNLRQDEVAFNLGIPASYLSNIENGKRETVSLITYLQIANYYEIDFGTIVKKANAKMKIDDCDFND